MYEQVYCAVPTGLFVHFAAQEMNRRVRLLTTGSTLRMRQPSRTYTHTHAYAIYISVHMCVMRMTHTHTPAVHVRNAIVHDLSFNFLFHACPRLDTHRTSLHRKFTMHTVRSTTYLPPTLSSRLDRCDPDRCDVCVAPITKLIPKRVPRSVTILGTRFLPHRITLMWRLCDNPPHPRPFIHRRSSWENENGNGKKKKKKTLIHRLVNINVKNIVVVACSL